MTQIEFDKAVTELRKETNAEYNKIDTRKVINKQRLEFLLNERKDIVAKIYECHTEAARIEADKNAITRRFDDRILALREQRDKDVNTKKEISSTVAYRLHAAVETALSAALGKYPDIDIANIKCNWHFAEDGTISFNVVIPEYGKEEE